MLGWTPYIRAELVKLARTANSEESLAHMYMLMDGLNLAQTRPRFCMGLLGVAVAAHAVESVRLVARYLHSHVTVDTDPSQLISRVVRTHPTCAMIEAILCQMHQHTGASLVDQVVAYGYPHRALRLMVIHGVDPGPACPRNPESGILALAREQHPSTLPLGMHMACAVIRRWMGDPGHVVISFLCRGDWALFPSTLHRSRWPPRCEATRNAVPGTPCSGSGGFA